MLKSIIHALEDLSPFTGHISYRISSTFEGVRLFDVGASKESNYSTRSLLKPATLVKVIIKHL